MHLLLLPLSFVCELVDSSLGLGYGTTLIPILLLLGYEPLQVVPAVLLAECASGLLGAIFHHDARNVDFSLHSRDTKVALLLASLSVIGTLAAVLIAIRLPAHSLKLLIGVIVLGMGVLLVTALNRPFPFGWRKLAAIGALASFNKGLSGGGYGPLVMGGQLLSGVGVKNAIGIVSLAEGITCLVGVLLYYRLAPDAEWTVAPWLAAGAALSVPIAARLVQRTSESMVRRAVTVAILTLGGLTVYKALI